MPYRTKFQLRIQLISSQPIGVMSSRLYIQPNRDSNSWLFSDQTRITTLIIHIDSRITILLATNSTLKIRNSQEGSTVLPDI